MVMGKRVSGPPKLQDNDKRSSRVRTVEKRVPYQNYFSIAEHDISVPQFDGGFSEVVTRAAFVSADAIAVLPYDPIRDRVLLIEQFRFGPHIRGDDRPWKLEAIAGRIDPGETPKQAAHREAGEEAGLTFSELLPMPGYYPAPGAVAEYIHAYLGLAELPDEIVGVSGLPVEAEDIQSHVFGFEAAMEMLANGALDTGPLVICMQWLALRRDDIRRGA